MSGRGGGGSRVESARRMRRTLLAVFVVSGLALLCGAPALALSQRGHVFSAARTFGSRGSGEGQLSSPAGVAVSEVGTAAGDVYVVDRGDNRIEQFDSAGKFISAWGWGVKNGEREYQVCKSGEGCGAGIPGSGKGAEEFHIGRGQLIAPEGIAVDNSKSAGDPSAGDVYVITSVVPEKSYVEKFGPNGEYLGRVTKKEETEDDGRPEGVAVDPQGVVWVDWSEAEISSFTDAEPNKRVDKEEEVEAEVENLRPGLAVDATGNLFLNHEPAGAFSEASEGRFSEEGKGEHGEQPCVSTLCYVAKIKISEGSGVVETERVNRQNTTDVAADAANDDIYLDNATSIAAYGPDGTLIQRFGTGDLTRGSGVAIEAGDRNVYVVDGAADRVAVFVPEPAGTPEIDEVSAAKITASTAELAAQVDPKGSETTVAFEYGTDSCSGGGCTTLDAATTVPAGFGDQARSVEVGGLSPETVYHYRVTASSGTYGSVTSEERTFTTQSGAAFALPDGRAWELVSPVGKNGAGIEAITKEGGLIEAAEDGSGITYVAAGPTEAGTEGNRSPELTQILSTRVTNGEGRPEWSSKDIATPNDSATGVEAGAPPEYQFFSPDLSQAIVRPKGFEPALSQEASEVTPYLRDNADCGPVPSACYKPLVTGREGYANVPSETKFGGAISRGVQLVDAEPDLRHVILRSQVPLTAEAAASGENLYEWSEGSLSLINLEPEAEGGGAVAEARLGVQNNDVRHALADDGNRVFWTAGKQGDGEEFERLYVRDTAKHETLRIDIAQGVAEPAVEGASFEAASSDGSKVFFTDTQELTSGSRASEESPDLYECEIVERAGKLACDLEDLSEDTNSGGEKADVQGTVLATSEDGSVVYFVADGVLSTTENAEHEKASPGECLARGSSSEGTCNLYLERYDAEAGHWEAPRFVASLANSDEPDWATGDQLGELSRLTARVSPSGDYLAFMSDRSLTGYDNRDASSGALDEEVYLYDTESGGLTCVSCNPSGGRPEGVFDTEEAGEGLGLVVDRPNTWTERWIAGSVPGWTGLSVEQSLYQSRYLSDSGRLFFNSADALVPADKNGKEDVYEYEPSKAGSCDSEPGCVALISSGTSERESAFLDASQNGDDVFFLTAAALTGQDEDTNFDVYDARVCGSEGCVTKAGKSSSTCEEAETCRAAAPSEPVFSAPASTAPSGSSNLTRPPVATAPPKKVAPKPTRAQELSKALKSCKKLKRKKKRLACEALARKKYGAKKASHKASSSRKGHG
jgi:hypothetical protein